MRGTNSSAAASVLLVCCLLAAACLTRPATAAAASARDDVVLNQPPPAAAAPMPPPGSPPAFLDAPNKVDIQKLVADPQLEGGSLFVCLFGGCAVARLSVCSAVASAGGWLSGYQALSDMHAHTHCFLQHDNNTNATITPYNNQHQHNQQQAL